MNRNIFIRFAQRQRTYFTNYERNLFCLIDLDRKKRDGILERLLSAKATF